MTGYLCQTTISYRICGRPATGTVTDAKGRKRHICDSCAQKRNRSGSKRAR